MNGWKRTTLGNVLSVQNGYAFDSKQFGSTGFPLIRIRDLKAGISTETRYGGEYDGKYVVNAGDFLIGMDGEFGCYEWKGEAALLNQRVCRLQGFMDALEPRFLFYGINSYLKEIEDVTGFTTVKHLSSKQILGIEMPIPPRVEQRRIVEILDEAFEAIGVANGNAEKNLQNYHDLHETEIESIFSTGNSRWPLLPLDQVSAIINGYAFKSTDFQSAPGVRSIKITNVGVREFVDDSSNFLPETFSRKHAAFSVDKGSIVLALTRTIIADGLKVAVVPEAFHGALLNQRVAAIRPNSGRLECAFLYAFLSTRGVFNYVKAHVNTLMQPNLSIVDLRQLPIPVPSISAQEELVETLKKLDEEMCGVEFLYTRKLADLDELKKSLLHHAFTGQLTAKKTDRLVGAVV
jgi:type I restriction enzyme S subunit